ncbi:MAG: histidine phosphatase family protein [Waddliaceae bacterium]
MVTTVVAIRHAKPLSEGYANDSLRPLSEEGKIIQKNVLERLKAQGIQPTKLFSSPLLRARQTAQLVTDLFGIPSEDEPALGNAFDSKVLLQKLSLAEGDETIFLIGHAPTLTDFVNQLVGKAVLPNGMDKSSAAIVAFDGKIEYGRGQFLHYIKPE